MNPATAIAVSGAVGVLAGAVGALVLARYNWRKDKRETAEAKIALAAAQSIEAREREAAVDRQEDRLIRVLREANAAAIEAERLTYENKLSENTAELKRTYNQKLNEMRDSLLVEMQRKIDDALDRYGCETAGNGCPDRRFPVRIAPIDGHAI